MHHLLNLWVGWVLSGGYWGIIVLMAMESSIFPVPSEIVIPPAAFLAAQGKLSFTGVVLAGTLGSYLGAAITYWVSRLIGRPLIVKYGRLKCCANQRPARAMPDWTGLISPVPPPSPGPSSSLRSAEEHSWPSCRTPGFPERGGLAGLRHDPTANRAAP